MIIAGTKKDLVAAVYDTAGLQIASGTVYAVVRLESDDGYDGYYWVDSGDGYWDTAPTADTQATYLSAGMWLFELPASATSDRVGDVIQFTFTDDLTPASATSVAGGGEHLIKESISAWDETLADHTTSGTAGEKLDATAEPADVAVYESEPEQT